MSNLDITNITLPSFNFWQSWQGTFESLNWSDRGYLITWIQWYMFENKVPVILLDDPQELSDKHKRLVTIFNSLIPELDKQKEKYLDYLNKKQQ